MGVRERAHAVGQLMATQPYGEHTARAYDRIWSGYGASFGRAVAEHWVPSGRGAAVLDLGCGTGSLASALLSRGHRVTGIDASPHMLASARANCGGHIGSGAATFIQADIRDFELDREFELAVSSYDTVNHLGSIADLGKCFSCVLDALLPGGAFVFDLNTIRGLDDWNRVKITDREDHAVISRGFFDRTRGCAWKKFSGFYEVGGGLYERFEEVIFNTAFSIEDVVAELRRVGFEAIGIRDLRDPFKELPNPEAEDRVLVVSSKPPLSEEPILGAQ